jgi:hypothetical protein
VTKKYILFFFKRSPVHKIGYPKGTPLEVTFPIYKHLLVGVTVQCGTFLSHTHTLVFFIVFSFQFSSLELTSVPTILNSGEGGWGWDLDSLLA